MAKGDEPDMPQKDVERRKHKRVSSLYSEDLECRSRNLELALISKKILTKEQSKVGGQEQQKKMAYAVKLSSEFLANIIVGAVLGFGFDKLVGSLPWGLVFFLFLGFVAGILSVLRSVKYIAPSRLEQRRTLQQSKEDNKEV
ncbi:ATP synthase protein I [Bartonella sp. CDC_skunk]|uniref:AtpZ/AtpI family protein n=1 Tax=unclassified Bartonella TaxID=2645622 RepID=UPI00099AE057|nr:MULTISPECIES: AtpZ/AtpI family protein [unclassified Bartonella]AQX20996.1 ATP synthase protein I [Bartonella sp. CDC_skunk]AQX22579.1 ATP synthase protein I [Bartonella sp. 11B]AQX25028.1 ATP synthase protein I [Bartonella sp. Coyote22sub2]AQX26254.1 ATP synthase protein I [Bartonella sp. Raccoon60]